MIVVRHNLGAMLESCSGTCSQAAVTSGMLSLTFLGSDMPFDTGSLLSRVLHCICFYELHTPSVHFASMPRSDFGNENYLRV